MRKIVLWVLLLVLFMTSCSSSHSKDSKSIQNYESYVDAVLSNAGSVTKNIPFDYKMSVVHQEDQSYQYEIVISNPRIAMYNIQAIAVDPALDSNENVYPCLGLLGEDADTAFHMIPYQANGPRNYVNKIYVDGVTNESQFTIYVIVTWKDSTLTTTNRAFFTCNYAQKDTTEEDSN